MKSKLLVVLNNEITPFGMVMNAIGHMMVGVGPRVPVDKFPQIAVYSAPGRLVRRFRTEAAKLQDTLTLANCVFSDFAHTTTEGSAKDHETQTRAIKEENINYFAASICAKEDRLSELDTLLHSGGFAKLIYSASLSLADDAQSEFEFSDPITYPEIADFVENDLEKKFSIVLSPKLSVPDSIYHLIKACIAMGNKAERASLRLHQYPDADGILHPGMSEYGLVALAPRNVTRLNELATTTPGLSVDSHAIIKNHEQVAAIGLFGNRDILQTATNKNISMWRGTLKASDCVLLATDDISGPGTSYLPGYNALPSSSSGPATRVDEQLAEDLKALRLS